MTQPAIGQSGTVETWLASLERQLRVSLSEREQRLKLETLERFVEFASVQPDEMIEQCVFTRDDGVQKISSKNRRKYWEKIREFEESAGLEGANIVRSFFIHNGIMLQA